MRKRKTGLRLFLTRPAASYKRGHKKCIELSEMKRRHVEIGTLIPIFPLFFIMEISFGKITDFY